MTFEKVFFIKGYWFEWLIWDFINVKMFMYGPQPKLKNHICSASLGYGPTEIIDLFPWLFYQITRSCDQRGGANLPSFSAKLSASFWTVQYRAEALKPYLWFQSVDFLSRFTKRFSQKMLHTAVKVIRTYRQTTQNYLVHSTT